MKTLDKSRPYGTICGYVENGERYEQDGCLFREDGTMVGLPILPQPEPKISPVIQTAVETPDKQKLKPSEKRKPGRPPKTSYSPETKQMAIAMAETGKTIDEISKTLGVHRLAVHAWVKDVKPLIPIKESDELSRTVSESAA